MQNFATHTVCVNCAVSYQDLPQITDSPPAPEPPRPSGPCNNLTGFKGCFQCGSSYLGNACACGAVYDLVLPPIQAEVIPSRRVILPDEWRCVECRVNRDAIGTRLVCPLCQDAKPLPSGEYREATTTQNAESPAGESSREATQQAETVSPQESVTPIAEPLAPRMAPVVVEMSNGATAERPPLDVRRRKKGA